MSPLGQKRKWPTLNGMSASRMKKAATPKALNSNRMIEDRAAINAGSARPMGHKAAVTETSRENLISVFKANPDQSDQSGNDAPQKGKRLTQIGTATAANADGFATPYLAVEVRTQIETYRHGRDQQHAGQQSGDQEPHFNNHRNAEFDRLRIISARSELLQKARCCPPPG